MKNIDVWQQNCRTITSTHWVQEAMMHQAAHYMQQLSCVVNCTSTKHISTMENRIMDHVWWYLYEEQKLPGILQRKHTSEVSAIHCYTRASSRIILFTSICPSRNKLLNSFDFGYIPGVLLLVGGGINDCHSPQTPHDVVMAMSTAGKVNVQHTKNSQS